jgi:hypothetical protein
MDDRNQRRIVDRAPGGGGHWLGSEVANGPALDVLAQQAERSPLHGIKVDPTHAPYLLWWEATVARRRGLLASLVVQGAAVCYRLVSVVRFSDRLDMLHTALSADRINRANVGKRWL